MMLCFCDDLIFIEVFFESPCIGNNAVSTKLTTACGYRYIGCFCVLFETLIGVVWYDACIFVDNFDVWVDFVAEMF